MARLREQSHRTSPVATCAGAGQRSLRVAWTGKQFLQGSRPMSWCSCLINDQFTCMTACIAFSQRRLSFLRHFCGGASVDLRLPEHKTLPYLSPSILGTLYSEIPNNPQQISSDSRHSFRTLEPREFVKGSSICRVATQDEV